VIPALDGRAARRALAACAVAALLAAGCGGTPGPTPASTPSAAPGASASAPTDEPSPSESAEPPPSEEPSPPESEEPPPSAEPGETPGATESPGETPGATASPGGAAACTGSRDNRAFYAGVAAAVAWDVYCPVLPAGWFVDTGSFRASGGGRMEISYRGPGGQRLEIREGFFCGDQAGCLPAGPGDGSASFGDRAATLHDGGDGSWLVAADAGDGLAWDARGTGMDGAALAAYTAAFARVET
jgi:hypothetical protein